MFIVIFFFLIILFINYRYISETFISDSQRKDDIEDIAENIVDKLEENKDLLDNNNLDKKGPQNLLNLYNLMDKKLTNLEIQVKLNEKKLEDLIKKFRSSKIDEKDRDKLAKQTKEAFSKNLSKSVSLLSGLSQDESKKKMDDHYSKELTESDAKNTILKAVAPLVTDIFKDNKENASKLDKLFEDIPDTEAESLKDNYLTKNMVQCQCNDPQGEKQYRLGRILIKTVDDMFYDDINNKISKICGNDSECRREQLTITRHKAGEYLKNLSDIMGCKLNKLQGLFPHNVDEQS